MEGLRVHVHGHREAKVPSGQTDQDTHHVHHGDKHKQRKISGAGRFHRSGQRGQLEAKVGSLSFTHSIFTDTPKL